LTGEQTMTCVEWEVWISAYHDDALDAERRRAVEAHLAGCALCRATSEAFAPIGPMLKAAMTRDPAPETLFARVMTQLPEPSSRAPRWKPVLRPPRGWLSFGLAPVGILLWLLMSGPSAPKRDPGTTGATVPQMTIAPRPGAPRIAGPAKGRNIAPTESKQTPLREPGRAAPAQKESPSNVSPPPAPDPRPELEPLRRMQQRRPPRFQDRLARRPGVRLASTAGGRHTGSARRSHRRSRSHPERRVRPVLVAKSPSTGPRIQSPPLASRQPEPWVTVVDYVLPQAAPETTVGEGTEFVLRAAETYAVTPTRYEY
jgi:hypothetical protein